MIDILGLRAYHMIEARNGKQALDRAHAHEGRIHLLVTDLVMPELGGIELAAELRRRDPGLRVLYVSGYSQNAELLSEPLGPHTHFLAKPFLPGELTRADESGRFCHARFSSMPARPRGRGSKNTCRARDCSPR